MSTNELNKVKNERRITAEQTIILIRLIKKYRSLWDATHPNFTNRTVRIYLYEKIGKYFLLTGDDVRRKFRRLQNCYRQELKQICDEKKQYPNLFYFDEMEFLRKPIEQCLLKRQSVSCSSTLSAEEDLTDRFPAESFEELYTPETADYQHMDIELDPIPDVMKEHETPNHEEYIEEQSSLSEEVDEYDKYCAYLASQLREIGKINKIYALETMEEFQRLISQRRIKILGKGVKRNAVPGVQYRYSLKRSKSEQ